jgi:hypothetical protein
VLTVGNAFGRIIGISAGALGAIGALLSIGGAYPWWSLGIFACASTSCTASSSTATRTP